MGTDLINYYVSSPSDSRNCSRLKEKQGYSAVENDWVFSKALERCLVFWHSCPVIKIGSFSTCMRNTECLLSLTAWEETQTPRCPWLWTWLIWWDCYQLWPGSHRQIWEFLSHQIDQSYSTFVITIGLSHFFSHPMPVCRLLSKQSNIFLFELSSWCQQCGMPFQNI